MISIRDAIRGGKMKILGIDPGLRAMGYGVVAREGAVLRLVDSGTIETRAKDPFPDRLRRLYTGVTEVIARHQPDVLVMEKPIYCQNMKTALVLGQAGGAAILAAAQAGIELVEFTPLEVKKAVTGKGRAGKEQVQKMVKVLLDLRELPPVDHISDALACAICYAHSEKLLRFRAAARR